MTAAERRRAARLLLALLAPRRGGIGDAEGADWHHAADLAREHRLGPHLHGQLWRAHGSAKIPDFVCGEWADAYRANALAVLAQRQAMASALTILGKAGIEAIALKGAALAWTVWPAPAERVMRDLDLLVPQARAADAYAVLQKAGWAGPAVTGIDLQAMATSETHLPPLVSPHGVALELHGHVWRSAPMPGGTMPTCDSAAFLERARWSGPAGARIPSAEDMLAHLIVHTACSHLFNVGPLALADMDYWLAANPIDWPAFWRRAETEGFARPAALVLALTDRWRRPGLLQEAGCPALPDQTVIDEAEALLFQDASARKDINLIAGLRGGLAGAGRRANRHPLDIDSRKGRGAEMVQRGVSLARSLANRSIRESGLATHRVARWLGG